MTVTTDQFIDPSLEPSPPVAPELVGPKEKHPLVSFWFYFSQNKGAVIGLGFVLFVSIIALLAPLIAPYNPIEQFRDAFLAPPSWVEGGDPRFFLGTDATGRDILSRLMYGARLSLLIGFMVVIIALFFGVILGVLAGFYQKLADAFIMRVMDLLLAFPALLLAIIIVTISDNPIINKAILTVSFGVLDPNLTKAMLAVALIQLPHFVRLTRAAVMTELTKDYVTSSRQIGASRLRLMFVVILPNCLAPLIVQATLGVSNAILDIAALGFLGLGAQPPIPEWGTMLADASEFIRTAWWVVTFPGLAILTTVLAFNLFGDGLRDAFDPKLKR